LLALYHTMVMARAIERRLWVVDRLTPGAAPVALHVGGSEGVQAAAAAVLRPGVDWVVPYHRDLALCLAMGMTPLDVMLAVFGRAADPTSAGRQAPGSFGSRRARILTTSAVVGAQVVHAAGVAYAGRVRGLDEVTLVSIGERGTDTGDWHEGLNFAAVHRLPLICLVQDDSASSGPLGPLDPDRLLGRAQGYGMAGQSIDGSDFEAAFQVLSRAAERARAGDGPTLVHARVPALTSLTPRGAFLARERLEAVARHDPIERMRLRLVELRLLDDQAEDQVQRDCIGVVDAAVEQAMAAALPEAARALDNVFQETRADA
jgi:2-oxoisovalerate dehydrogenase E1 component subunit alpha